MSAVLRVVAQALANAVAIGRAGRALAFAVSTLSVARTNVPAAAAILVIFRYIPANAGTVRKAGRALALASSGILVFSARTIHGGAYAGAGCGIQRRLWPGARRDRAPAAASIWIKNERRLALGVDAIAFTGGSTGRTADVLAPGRAHIRKAGISRGAPIKGGAGRLDLGRRRTIADGKRVSAAPRHALEIGRIRIHDAGIEHGGVARFCVKNRIRRRSRRNWIGQITGDLIPGSGCEAGSPGMDRRGKQEERN